MHRIVNPIWPLDTMIRLNTLAKSNGILSSSNTCSESSYNLMNYLTFYLLPYIERHFQIQIIISRLDWITFKIIDSLILNHMSEDSDTSFDNDELTEFNQDQGHCDEDAAVSVNSQSVKSRGRPRIQEQWSRVISVDVDNLENLKTFPLATDLLLADGIP